MLVGGWRQFRLVVDFALERSGTHVEGVCRRKANLDHAAIVLQRIGSVGQKLTIEQNIAGRGLGPYMSTLQIDQLETAADRGNLDSTGATQALERATHG